VVGVSFSYRGLRPQALPTRRFPHHEEKRLIILKGPNLQIKYIVDEDSHFVQALFEDQIFDMHDYLDKHVTRDKRDDFFYLSHYVELSDLTGIARLHPDDKDKFDEEFGKKLAKMRLLNKFYRRLKNELNENITEAFHAFEKILCFYEKSINLVIFSKIELAYLKSLTEEVKKCQEKL